MSRTYRRRRYRQLFGSDNPLMDYFVTDDEVVWEDVQTIAHTHDYGFMINPRYNVRYSANSKTGRRLIAKASSDAATHSCKEPGPGWFRNLYSDRPLRRKAKEELRKYMMNEEYEPMIEDMPPLPYWT